jgi:hypothetical protein
MSELCGDVAMQHACAIWPPQEHRPLPVTDVVRISYNTSNQWLSAKIVYSVFITTKYKAIVCTG